MRGAAMQQRRTKRRTVIRPIKAKQRTGSKVIFSKDEGTKATFATNVMLRGRREAVHDVVVNWRRGVNPVAVYLY